MSSTPARLGAFALVLAALFGIGALAGDLFDPDAPGDEANAHAGSGAQPRAGGHAPGNGSEADDHGSSRSATSDGHGPASAGAGADGHGAGGHGGESAADPVRGLAVAENGLRLVVADAALTRGTPEQLRFRIVDDAGHAVRDFDVEHTKRMHAIVVRRDLTGFQHLHPTLHDDGTWTVPLRIDQPGSYRVFADFSVDGEATTLASELRVDGSAALRELPAAEPVATSDGGYEVQRSVDRVRPGKEAELHFAIGKDGQPVEVEPYLGAGGHLVALREGDLAFLHVHPTDEHASEIGFAATFPTAGRYRLFLQFKVDGRVQTVAFTQEVR